MGLSGEELKKLKQRVAKTRKNTSHKLGKEGVEALMREYIAGVKTLKELSAKYGVCTWTVRYHIRRTLKKANTQTVNARQALAKVVK